MDFRPKLKEHMQYCMNHPEEMSKLAKVKAQISEVKGIMMDNIEKVGSSHPQTVIIFFHIVSQYNICCMGQSIQSMKIDAYIWAYAHILCRAQSI